MENKLPTLREVEILKLSVFGYELVFRKVTLDDLDRFNEAQVDEGLYAFSLNKYMLAHLMYGYPESFEERLKFLNSIQVDNLDVIKESDDVLAQLGVKYEKAENVELAKQAAREQIANRDQKTEPKKKEKNR